MSADEKLAHALKLNYGTAPSKPTASQLISIKAQIAAIEAVGRRPTDDDWRRAVRSACPDAGRYKYGGLDNSDLNTLLALATKSAGE